MPRILLVEDDRDVRFMVEHVLVDDGHKVDAAATMTGGLHLLRSGTYDLVLTDGRLPDGTGLDIADNAVERGVKALVMTGYAFSFAPRPECPYEILLKPLRPREIIAAVDRTLLGTA